MKVEYSKFGPGCYRVYLQNKPVGWVSKNQTAARSFWYFEPKGGYEPCPAKNIEPRDCGWRSWDQTRDGAVAKHFGGVMYEGKDLINQPLSTL